MQPTRFEIDGVRHYRTGDDPNKYYPSVTAILGRTATEKDNKSLLSWQLRNPGGREAAAQRGSAVHLACEKFNDTPTTEISDEHRPFWDGLAKHLDKYDYFIWSEKPLDPRWRYCTGEDGISRIWSHDYQYCGCPDLVGVRNGVTILSDFKTSVGPYNRYFPDKSDKDRTKYTGWKKFFKCSIQLAAYTIAIQETLGVKIDAAQILVSTPEIDQNFLLHGNDLIRFRHKWLVKVRKYQELIEAERQEAPDRELELVAA